MNFVIFLAVALPLPKCCRQFYTTEGFSPTTHTTSLLALIVRVRVYFAEHEMFCKLCLYGHTVHFPRFFHCTLIIVSSIFHMHLPQALVINLFSVILSHIMLLMAGARESVPFFRWAREIVFTETGSCASSHPSLDLSQCFEIHHTVAFMHQVWKNQHLTQELRIARQTLSTIWNLPHLPRLKTPLFTC